MTEPDSPKTTLINCPRGCAEILKEELAGYGFEAVEADDKSVTINATFMQAVKLNLVLRSANYVLCELARFKCDSIQRLYDSVCSIGWEEIIAVEEYFSVVSRTATPSVDNTMFCNMKVKDAIVDRINNAVGARPDSGPERRGAVVHVYWYGSDCRIYLNLSGRKLSDRGYRKMPGKAPMSETLAASIILMSRYEPQKNIVLPMCGSGTLAIEAALIATKRSPGLLRTNFGFEHLKWFNAEKFGDVRAEIKKVKPPSNIGRIIATDIDARAVDAAKKNAKTAGVDHLIEFDVCDFAETAVPEGGGAVILNPEYGLRMGDTKKLGQTYNRIGDFFKQKCAGYFGYIFTGNLDLAKKVGLRTSSRKIIYNAKIECRLLEYEMYEGSR